MVVTVSDYIFRLLHNKGWGLFKEYLPVSFHKGYHQCFPSKEGLGANGGEEEGARTGGSSPIFFTVIASCVSK